MSDSMMHPEPERLEAYVEGSLPETERAVVDSHVLTCARCQTAAEEWRTLFAELAQLTRPAPSPGFADRVLADVRLHRPLAVRAAERFERFVPDSTGGWAVAAALIALPVLAGVGAVAWLLSRPWLSAEGLWLFLRRQAVEALVAGADWTVGAIANSALAHWIAGLADTVLANAGPTEIGLGLGLLAALVTGSAWIVYRNVFRTPTRDVHYASYCF